MRRFFYVGGEAGFISYLKHFIPIAAQHLCKLSYPQTYPQSIKCTHRNCNRNIGWLFIIVKGCPMDQSGVIINTLVPTASNGHGCLTVQKAYRLSTSVVPRAFATLFSGLSDTLGWSAPILLPRRNLQPQVRFALAAYYSRHVGQVSYGRKDCPQSPS